MIFGYSKLVRKAPHRVDPASNVAGPGGDTRSEVELQGRYMGSGINCKFALGPQQATVIYDKG